MKYNAIGGLLFSISQVFGTGIGAIGMILIGLESCGGCYCGFLSGYL